MKKVSVNKSLNFEIDGTGSDITVNGESVLFDIKGRSARHFHILLGNRSYSAELVSVNYKKKEVNVKVNGTPYSLELTDEYDELLKDMGMQFSNTADVGQLNAPMPGLVLHLLAKVGDTLKKGEGMLVLEAMKMENLIKSPCDLVITSVEVNEGQKVEKNQVLMHFDPLI